jgi:nitrite reductase/ring-hydroxylating ferredoxin subunit
MPKFMKVATADELEDQQAKLVEVEGQKIALFRVGQAFHALSDTCTHRGGPLSEGTVEGADVACPWHGARFDIETGAVMRPATVSAFSGCWLVRWDETLKDTEDGLEGRD